MSDDNTAADNTADSAAGTSAAKRGYRKWTAEEIDTIRLFANLGAANIATMLNRPKIAIYNKAKQLGVSVSLKQSTPEQV